MPRRKGARPVFLIGFMGSGKSVVGRLLARRLGLPFADTDRAVERSARRSVARVFSELGEAAFRRLETAALRRAGRGPAVVAAGGGAVLRPANVALMRRAGSVVHLDAPAAALWARVRRDGLGRRPVLAREGAPPRLALGRLLRRRLPLYRAARHLRVDGRGSAAAVAAAVEAALRRRGLL